MRILTRKTVRYRGYAIVLRFLPDARYCMWSATITTGETSPCTIHSISSVHKTLRRSLMRARLLIDRFHNTGSWEHPEEKVQ